MGRASGISEEKLAALAEYEVSPLFEERERLALRYADAMANTPVEVPAALFDELRRYFDESQLVELTSAIAWEHYRARFNHALEIESEGFSEGAFCPVPLKARAEG